MSEATIRGYRIVGEAPKQRELSYDYMMLDAKGSHALLELRASVTKNGANCVGREEEFSGEELPSDRDAQLMCAGCPSFKECDFYRMVAHPSWGVYSGVVQGRKLAEAMKDEED